MPNLARNRLKLNYQYLLKNSICNIEKSAYFAVGHSPTHNMCSFYFRAKEGFYVNENTTFVWS